MGINFTDIAVTDPVIAATFNDRLDELDQAIKKNNYAATGAPVVGDDSADGYTVGSRWIDTTNDRVYMAVDVTVGAAIWLPLQVTSAFFAHKNAANQTIPDTTATKATFGTEAFDLLGDYSTATSTWTPATKGAAVVVAQINLTDNNDGSSMRLRIYKNGSVASETIVKPGAANFQAINVTFMTQVNGSTDTIEIYVQHFDGGNRTLSGATTATYFSGYVIPTP